MNWKLILGLSLFGLAMAGATVSLIPPRIEALCWLVIFAVCAVALARMAPGRLFLHGFLIGLVNCVWVTGAHVLFFDAYLGNHLAQAAQLARSPLAARPRLMMTLTGPVIGAVSGLVLGAFAAVAGRFVKRR